MTGVTGARTELGTLSRITYRKNVNLVAEAAQLSESLVSPLGRRWAHVQSVAGRADGLRKAVRPTEYDLLIAAAWLHDIGYSPDIGLTHFHPLDGARYLRAQGWHPRLVNLVAHHSGARFEAMERGLSDELEEFALEDSPVMDALVTADLTTGPDGGSLSYDQRIDEILGRYPTDDPVHRTWTRARPILADAVTKTYKRLAIVHPK